MKRYEIVPNGWLCSLSECPPGPFTFDRGDQKYLGFKSEYCTETGRIEAFNSAGEFYCPGGTEPDRNHYPVQPVIMICVEY